MNIKIIMIIAYFIIGNVNADELLKNKYAKLAELSGYKLCIANLKFTKEDELMPGITVGIEPKSLENTDFRLTYARTLILDEEATLQNLQLTDNTIFAQINYKF